MCEANRGLLASLEDRVTVGIESFEKLVEDHYDRLFRAALFMSGDRETAEELVQDCFLAAGESLATFQERSSVYTWLYGILLNKFRKWLRKRGGTVSLQQMAEKSEGDSALLAADGIQPLQRLEREEMAQQVQKAIRELSPRHRSALTLRYVEELSYEEISATLGCSIGTVKSRIHYALKKVAHQLRQIQG